MRPVGQPACQTKHLSTTFTIKLLPVILFSMTRLWPSPPIPLSAISNQGQSVSGLVFGVPLRQRLSGWTIFSEHCLWRRQFDVPFGNFDRLERFSTATAQELRSTLATATAIHASQCTRYLPALRYTEFSRKCTNPGNASRNLVESRIDMFYNS